MLHQVARAASGRLLFRTWAEATMLWRALSVVPGMRALVLMPDHVHVLAEGDVRRALGSAASGYTRWLNHRRCVRGSLWDGAPPPSEVRGRVKIGRNERYIHLNPCRKALCVDPLAWPFSTHRDRVGLSLDPVVERASQPVRHHAYVSSDPTVDVSGTDLPQAPGGVLELGDIEAAVSALARVPRAHLRVRSPARDVAIRAARTLTGASVDEVADWLGVGRRTVNRRKPGLLHDVRLVERVARDPRFFPLDGADLARSWPAYRGKQ